jgi:hypothetical protein
MKTLRFALLLMLLGPAMVMSSAHIARAQICPGSQLFYVVRDSKGAIIDAGRSDLKYEGDSGKDKYRHWGSEAINAGHLRSKEVPADISKLNGTVMLKNQAMCNFKDDVKLSVTLAGKTMNLVFHVPKLSDVESKDFVVDSLPFKAGDYEITLNMPPDTWVNFYPAKGWQKATAKP